MPDMHSAYDVRRNGEHRAKCVHAHANNSNNSNNSKLKRIWPESVGLVAMRWCRARHLLHISILLDTLFIRFSHCSTLLLFRLLNFNSICRQSLTQLAYRWMRSNVAHNCSLEINAHIIIIYSDTMTWLGVVFIIDCVASFICAAGNFDFIFQLIRSLFVSASSSVGFVLFFLDKSTGDARKIHSSERLVERWLSIFFVLSLSFSLSSVVIYYLKWVYL